MKRCVDSGLWVPNKDDPTTNAEDGFVTKEEFQSVCKNLTDEQVGDW